MALQRTHRHANLQQGGQEPEQIIDRSEHESFPSPRTVQFAALLRTQRLTSYFQGVGGVGPPAFFQGVGGVGPPAFFQGVGGVGPPAFFQGVGGVGPPAFAITTEPSPWVTTTVFRLIAPTSTRAARNTTVSLRDIVPPRFGTTQETVYLLRHQCQRAQSMSLFRIDTH